MLPGTLSARPLATSPTSAAPLREGETPDLVVSFTLGARDRVQRTEYPSSTGADA